jgi:ribonuclease BN (tRNA processing enzyme)
MNQLTVLGGSAAGVGTGMGCSAYLVTVNDTNVVLDLGPDTIQQLRKHVDYRMLDAIVVSHLHLDHILDLFALRFMLSYNPVKADRKLPLYLPPDGLAFFSRAAELFATSSDDVGEYFSAVFHMQEYDPAESITVGDITISFAPTVHIIPCWAMRVRPNEGHDIVYTADSGTDANLDNFIAGAAVVVADSAAAPDAPDFVKAGIHYDAAAATTLARDAGANHLVLTHQWEEADPMNNAAIAREIFPGRISIASPGLTVTW